MVGTTKAPNDRQLRNALMAFIVTIENTGGVYAAVHVPVADPSWGDLGEAYMEACAILGRQPRIASFKMENELDSELVKIQQANATVRAAGMGPQQVPRPEA